MNGICNYGALWINSESPYLLSPKVPWSDQNSFEKGISPTSLTHWPPPCHLKNKFTTMANVTQAFCWHRSSTLIKSGTAGSSCSAVLQICPKRLKTGWAKSGFSLPDCFVNQAGLAQCIAWKVHSFTFSRTLTMLMTLTCLFVCFNGRLPLRKEESIP